MAHRIKITPELRMVHEPEPEYADLPEGWDGWTPEQRDAHLDALGAETIETLAGVGVAVVDEDDNEVDHRTM